MRHYKEFSLQILLNKWVKECVPTPHFFSSSDRSQKHGRYEHVRQKARGIIAGIPDTQLIVPGFAPIAVELKAPGNKPTEQQIRVGKAIIAAGGHWDWCDSVFGYWQILYRLGVPLHAHAETAAMAKDATLLNAAIAHEENKTGRVSAKRKQEPRYVMSKAMVARVRKVGIEP